MPAAVERTPARRGSIRETWESNFAEREWADDDPKWELLRNALSLIEDLEGLEAGKWGPNDAAIAAGRATCILMERVLFAFGDQAGCDGYDFRDYALSRQAVTTISRSLDALVEGVR